MKDILKLNLQFLSAGLASIFALGLCVTAHAEEDDDEVHQRLEVEAKEILVIQGDPDYGEYLAGECVTCHQTSGKYDGIPPIAGLDAEYFVTTLLEYKYDVRDNQVMKLRATALGYGEMAALAAYFAKLGEQ